MHDIGCGQNGSCFIPVLRMPNSKVRREERRREERRGDRGEMSTKA